ncbi:MAG: hypothetical protein ABJQ29_10500 [Luteolibacter sp.]
MKTTLQLLAATLGVLAIASCTAHIDTPAGGASSSTTTTTSTDGPFYGETQTTKKTTVTY